MVTILFIAFVILLLIGVPIAVSLGIASVLAIFFGSHMPLLLLPQKIFNGVNSFPFMAIPLFLLAGNIMAEAKKLEGKSVECEVDGRRFSKAVAKLVCSKDSSTTSPLIVEAELTLKAPYRGLVGYCSWQYRDANGHELSSGASPVDDSGKYKAGDTIRQSFTLAVTQEKAKSSAKIYFTE